MLFRPFVTFVVLTINLGKTFAMPGKENPSVPENIDSYNQPPTVPIDAAMNHLSINQQPSTDQRKIHKLHFGRRKKPEVPQSIDPQYNMEGLAFQSPHHPHHHPHPHPHPHHHPHSPNIQPIQRIFPPQEDPHFSEARCGFAYYNRDDIISAREEGCRKMPFYHDNLITKKATPYYPADATKYKGDTQLYLYPIGRPFRGVTRTKHHGFDRIVLNKWCQALGVLTERPHITEFAVKTGNYFTGRPLQNYNQKNYKYIDCRLS